MEGHCILNNKTKLKTKLVYSKSTNPWFNLAYEEFILDNLEPEEITLYLWQNDNTVVIGRNQNSWKECRCKELEKNKGKLARRLSGGGAVYHDLGNLNFTFVTNKKNYNFERQIGVILKAVKSMGIDATFTGRNDLEIEGKKFSGNAFYFKGDKSYHHGTILIDTDFEKLQNYLTVSSDKIKSKGIDSIRARVINLCDLTGIKEIKPYSHAFYREFQKEYGICDEVIEIKEKTHLDEISTLYEKYSHWDFRYGDSPNWELEGDKKFSWGKVSFGLTIKKGKIAQIGLYSDAMESTLSQCVKDNLYSMKLNELIDELCEVWKEKSLTSEEKEVYGWIFEEVKNLRK